MRGVIAALWCWTAVASAGESITSPFPDHWSAFPLRHAAAPRRQLAATDGPVASSILAAKSPTTLMSALASVANPGPSPKHTTILVQPDIDLSLLSLHSSATVQPLAVLGSDDTLLIQGQTQSEAGQTCRYSSSPELGLGYLPGLIKYQGTSSNGVSITSQTTPSQQALLGTPLSTVRIVFRGLFLYSLPFGLPSTFPPGFLRLGLWMFDFGAGIDSRVSVTTLDTALATSEARLVAQTAPLVHIDNCTLVVSQVGGSQFKLGW
jgi:hypothetical protein